MKNIISEMVSDENISKGKSLDKSLDKSLGKSLGEFDMLEGKYVTLSFELTETEFHEQNAELMNKFDGNMNLLGLIKKVMEEMIGTGKPINFKARFGSV